MRNKILILALMVPLVALAQRNGSYPSLGGGSVTPAQIAAAGGVTNGMVGEVLLFTNNVAMLPGFGYTNWPNSVSAGIYEIAQLYAMPAIRNPAGGVKIKLASAASTNKPAFYTITACVNFTNYIELEGNGMGATYIEYKGPPVGTTNDKIPVPLMFYTPPLVSGGASNALGFLAMKNLSLMSDVDCPSAMIVTYANAFNFNYCQFGSTNMLYQTNFVSTVAYVGASSTAPRGLIGVYMQGQGNNQDGFYNCFFQDLADAVFADGVDWGVMEDCHFGSISMLNSSTIFTNTWNTNIQYHVGACLGMSGGGLGWSVKNNHALNVNTFFYGTASPAGTFENTEVENGNWYSLGCLPDTEAHIIPTGTLGTWSAVNTFFQANDTRTSVVGNGFLRGLDGNDDYQYKLLDDTLATMVSIPNKAEQNNDGSLYSIGPIVFTGNRGLEVINGNGHGITNMAQNTVTFTNFLLGSSFTNTTPRNMLVVGNFRCNPTTTGNALVALVTSPTGITYTTNSIVGLEADAIFTTTPHSWYQLTAQVPPGGVWKFIDKTGEGLVTVTNSYYQTLQ